MAAPLSDYTIEEQRAVVRFLWAEEVKPAETRRGLLAQSGARTSTKDLRVDRTL
jgi:hypothetical protein